MYFSGVFITPREVVLMDVNSSLRSYEFNQNPSIQQKPDVKSTQTETIDKPETKQVKQLNSTVSRLIHNISTIAKTAFASLSSKIASVRQKDTTESDLDPNTAALREADGLPALQDGKEITDNYIDDKGKEYGTETVNRKSMVKDHINLLDNALKEHNEELVELKKELQNPNQKETDKQKIQQKINQVAQKIEFIQRSLIMR
jgi:hypothetical protein